MHPVHSEDTWLVTGGAGFIGANFVLAARGLNAARIVNLDCPHLRRQPEEPGNAG